MRIRGAKEARDLAEKGLQVLQSAEPERRRRLETKRGFYAFVVSELETLLGHWREHKSNQPLDR